VTWEHGGVRRPLPSPFRRAAGLVAAALVAAVCVWLPSASASAPVAHKPRHHVCSHQGDESVSQAVDTADAVFAGKVISVKGRVATVSVGTMVKGSPGDTEKIAFAKGWSCGQAPKNHATYVFFVTGRAGHYVVPADLPTSSSDVDKTVAEARQLLTPPAPTVSLSPPLIGKPLSFLRVAVPGIAAVVVGLIGLLIVRLRRA